MSAFVSSPNRSASILSLLRDGPRSLDEIRWRLHANRQKIQHELERLEAEGFVERRQLSSPSAGSGRPANLWRIREDAPDLDDDEDMWEKDRMKSACAEFLADLRRFEKPLVSLNLREGVPLRLAAP